MPLDGHLEPPADSLGNQVGNGLSSGDLEQRLNAIRASSMDALIEIDAAGRIAGWNPQAERTFGWTCAEALRQPVQMLIPARFQETHQQILEEFRTTGESELLNTPVETKLLRNDGQEFLAELIVSPFLSGTSHHFIAIARDITERRRTAEQLRESEERSRSILDHLEDAYSEVDLRGTYTFVNDAYCRLFNRTREEVVGASYKHFYLEHSAELRDAFQRVYQTGRPIKSFEHEFRPGRYNELAIWLKRDKNGEPIGFASSIRDCTERKLYEKALAHAKEAAEAANKAKSFSWPT